MSHCKTCKRKVNKIMVDVYTCKCLSVYCPKHLHNHQCSFDHKKEQQNMLREKMPVIQSNKGLIAI